MPPRKPTKSFGLLIVKNILANQLNRIRHRIEPHPLQGRGGERGSGEGKSRVHCVHVCGGEAVVGPGGREPGRETRSGVGAGRHPGRGLVGDGFQIIESPQMAANAAFHDQTATGKLNALMIPMGPSGCHCSYILWPGRSECIVLPQS